jgi:hypothetical protein
VLKLIAKQLALKAFPHLAPTFFSIRSRRYREVYVAIGGLDRVARQVSPNDEWKSHLWSICRHGA